jgi:hypothetical protein
VWSPAKGRWIWNPLEEQVSARLAMIKQSCICPGCGPVGNVPGDWECSVVPS